MAPMETDDPEVTRCLLAVDLGLRTGLALFGEDGRLRWYRSQNYGARSRLRRAVPGVLEPLAGLHCIVVEGDRALAEVWTREAERRGATSRVIAAETWRRVLLKDRDQRSGEQAKRNADVLARRVIEWSGAQRPTSLRHDAAEAVLIGLWGVLQLGWLDGLPPALR
jgi:hypothetical protein